MKYFRALTMAAKIIACSLIIFTVQEAALADQTSYQPIEVNQLADIRQHIDRYTLVIFDLDNTLMRDKYLFGSPEWIEHHIHQAKLRGISTGQAFSEITDTWHDFQNYTDVKLVDSNAPAIFNWVKQNSLGVIALTARGPRVAQATHRHLEVIGISFDNSEIADYNYHSKSKYPSRFYEGVIFADGRNAKGEIFASWFEQVLRQANNLNRALPIKKIVMIDDKKSNLLSVQQSLQDYPIEFIGVRYGACDHLMNDYNQSVAMLQESFFNNIIPNHIAKAILETKEGQKLLTEFEDPITNPFRHSAVHSTPSSLNQCQNTPGTVGIEDVNSILDVGQKIKPKSLVVFGLTNTLVKTKELIGTGEWPRYLMQIKRKETLSRKQALDRLLPMWHRVLSKTTAVPVDYDIPQTIRDLTKKGSHVMAITSRQVEMAQITLQQLQNVSIDLSQQAAFQHDLTIGTEFPAKFINGILFVGLQNQKDEAFVRFLKSYPIDYSEIVFIDDKYDNLNQLVAAARKLNIPAKAYRYVHPTVQNCEDDMNIAKLQLVLFDKIIPDEIAYQLVNNPLVDLKRA